MRFILLTSFTLSISPSFCSSLFGWVQYIGSLTCFFQLYPFFSSAHLLNFSLMLIFLFSRFPKCLLHRFNNFTGFFKDITFILQRFIGPLNSVFFGFCSSVCWIYCLCQDVFLKSVIVCSFWESLLASSIYRSLPSFIWEGVGSAIGLSIPGFRVWRLIYKLHL